MSRRAHRVEDLLRSEISSLLLRELSDPRVRMTSVSAVDVSPDLKRALVRVSVIGAETERQASLDALRHAGGYIRSCLASRLKNMRAVPQLVFELDRGAEHSQKISDLLENLHERDESP
jgi:ribosome-binding factor A